MQIQKRTLNWLPRPSAWHQAEADRAKRRAAADDFISRQQGFANAFAGVQAENVQALGNLIAQAAQARINRSA